MLRHLLQPHIMTYPEVFYTKVFLKVLQNSQENNRAEVSFSCNFNKNEPLELVVSYEFLPNCFDVKMQKANVCTCFLSKCIYVLNIFKSNNNNLFTANAAVVLRCD